MERRAQCHDRADCATHQHSLRLAYDSDDVGDCLAYIECQKDVFIDNKLFFYTYQPHSFLFKGTANTNTYDGTVPDTPNLFIDKETIAVSIKHAYVEGVSGTIYTDCEVYPIFGFNTDVSRLGYLLASMLFIYYIIIET